MLLEMKRITKVYPNGVVANRGIDFSLDEGEIHAIVGENGAGKSTLMKILFGIEEPTSGSIAYNGQAVHLGRTDDAIRMGIGMVHQHFMLVPSLTVAENLVLGREPRRGLALSYAAASRITAEIAARYNMSLDPRERVQDLSVGKKQKLEILKALYRGAKILILDEPTAVLTPQETEELFIELRNLRDLGHTLVFISHKLREVKALSDRITVLRAGRSEGCFLTGEVDEQEISRRMVGRDVFLSYDKALVKDGAKALTVRALTVPGPGLKPLVNNLSLAVRAGEILGVAGVEGNGQATLVEVLTGRCPTPPSTVTLGDRDVSRLRIGALRQLGVAYIPEDRMRQGTAKEATIADNLISTRFRDKALTRGPLLNLKAIGAHAQSLIGGYQVVCSGPLQPIGMLSGGNMQKVVVARECSGEPRVLIAEQPTRGVDVGAAELIHHQLLQLRDQGCAVVLVSADLAELLELSDRLVVLYDGELTAHFSDPRALGEGPLGLAMLGLSRQSDEERAGAAL